MFWYAYFMKRTFLPVLVFGSLFFIVLLPVFTARAEDDVAKPNLFMKKKMGTQGDDLLKTYKEARDNYLKFKGDCKNIESTASSDAKCGNFPQVALEKAKQALLNQLDAFDRVFQNFLTRFDGKADDRSTKEKEILNSAYDAYKIIKEQYKQKIHDAKTMVELREINKNMRADMKQALSLTRIAGGRINVLKATELLSRLRKKAEEVNKLITKVSGMGKDVTVATEYYNKAVTNMDLAQAKYDEALNLFKNMTSESAITDSEKAQALVKEGNLLLRDAFKNLKLAVGSLRDSRGKILKEGSESGK